jgi:hypothetical protein
MNATTIKRGVGQVMLWGVGESADTYALSTQRFTIQGHIRFNVMEPCFFPNSDKRYKHQHRMKYTSS